jgi:DNA-directed RNA polymerase specialized sigma24 family protein
MNSEQKKVRRYLKEAALDEYKETVSKAALTPLQEEVLELHILGGLSLVQISFKLHLSVRAITDRLARAYKKILRTTEAG